MNVKTIKLSFNKSLQYTGKASIYNLIPQLFIRLATKGFWIKC